MSTARWMENRCPCSRANRTDPWRKNGMVKTIADGLWGSGWVSKTGTKLSCFSWSRSLGSAKAIAAGIPDVITTFCTQGLSKPSWWALYTTLMFPWLLSGEIFV